MTDSVPKPKLIKKSVLSAPKVGDTVAAQSSPTTSPGSVPKPTPIKNPVPPAKAANKVTAQPASPTSGEPTPKQPPKSIPPTPNKSQINHPQNPNFESQLGKKRFNRLRFKFSEYLQSGKRPPKELVDRTASEMQIPARLIDEALKTISGKASLSRSVGFRVEKTYFELVHDWNRHDWNGNFRKFIEEIATRCDVRSSAVRGWLRMLHRKKFFLEGQPLPTTDQQQTILAVYNQYLAGTEPPPQLLHAWIAYHLDNQVTEEQVHLILVTHRQQIQKNLMKRCSNNSLKPDQSPA